MSNKPSPAQTLSPYLTVTNVDAAAKFYQQAFNFDLLELNSDNDGTPIHAEMKYKDQLIMFGKEGSHGSSLKSPKTSMTESPITLCLTCEDVDHFHHAAVSHGAKSISAPEDCSGVHGCVVYKIKIIIRGVF